MNPTLKDLTLQAKAYAIRINPSPHAKSGYFDINDFSSRFAELLLTECSSAICNSIHTDASAGNMVSYNLGLLQAAALLTTIIDRSK